MTDPNPQEMYKYHYCIQDQRIMRIEDKIDKIGDKLDIISSVDGTVGKMSQQMAHMMTLLEKTNNVVTKPLVTVDAWKWLALATLALAVIIASLLGVKLPF